MPDGVLYLVNIASDHWMYIYIHNPFQKTQPIKSGMEQATITRIKSRVAQSTRLLARNKILARYIP